MFSREKSRPAGARNALPCSAYLSSKATKNASKVINVLEKFGREGGNAIFACVIIPGGAQQHKKLLFKTSATVEAAFIYVIFT